MKQNKTIHLVLPHTTEHSVTGRLKRHFDEIDIHTLSDICYINPSSEKQLQMLIEEIAQSVSKLPEIQDGAKYHLLLSGFPFAGIAAYELLTARFGSISIMIFDSKRKEYVSVPDASNLMHKIWERTQKVSVPQDDAAGGEQEK